MDLSSLRWHCQHAIATDEAPYTYLCKARGLAISGDGRFLYLGHNGPDFLATDRPAVVKARNARDATGPDHFATNTLIRLYGYRGKSLAADDQGRVYVAEGTGGGYSNSVWWPTGGAAMTNESAPVAGINIFDPDLGNRLYTIARPNCEGVAVKREGDALALYATDRLNKTLTRWQLSENGGAIVSAVRTGLGGGGEITNAGASSLRGVDLDANGRIWMADVGGNKVWRCDHNGGSMTNVTVPTPLDVSCADGRAYVAVAVNGNNAGSVWVLDGIDMHTVTNLVRPAASVTGVTNGTFGCLEALPDDGGICVHLETGPGDIHPSLLTDSRWQAPVLLIEPYVNQATLLEIR